MSQHLRWPPVLAALRVACTLCGLRLSARPPMRALLFSSTAHGAVVGDWVINMGQATNLAVNGLFKVRTVPDANSLTLETDAGVAIAGNGATGTGTLLIRRPPQDWRLR